jgi:hypothetical protein
MPKKKKKIYPERNQRIDHQNTNCWFLTGEFIFLLLIMTILKSWRMKKKDVIFWNLLLLVIEF